MVQIDKFTGWNGAATFLLANLIDQTHQAAIEVGIFADRIVDPFATLEHAGQNLIEIVNRESII